MKFSCDKCNTRYSIADERVRGRVLKIRCKACNHVITVREGEGSGAHQLGEILETGGGPPGGDDEHTRVSAPVGGGVEAGAGPDDWFVSFDGEQEGPLPLLRAIDRVRAERPRGRECYCWRAGFFVWLPVEDVPEFAPALARTGPPPSPAQALTKPGRISGSHPIVKSAATPPLPAVKQPTGSQAAVKQPTGSQPAIKQPTGSQAAVKQPTGSQAAVKQPTGSQAAVKQPTGSQPAIRPATAPSVKPATTPGQPALRGPSGSLPAVKQPTGAQPALKSTTGSQAAHKSEPKSPTKPLGAVPSRASEPTRPMGDVPELPAPPGHATSRSVSELPSFDSGLIGNPPESLMPVQLTRPETRSAARKQDDFALSGDPARPSLMPLQTTGPTLVAGAPSSAMRDRDQPLLVPPPDTGPVPLPPPPDDLPISEPSGLISLQHLAKPSLAVPKLETRKSGGGVVETFGGVPVQSIPTPMASVSPIIAGPGSARGAPPWMKWAALAGALATLSLAIAVVMLLMRKQTVIVVPPAPVVDGKKANDKPITIDDPGRTPAANATAGNDKQRAAGKKTPPAARSAVSVKPPSETLSASQRNLASLYRDDADHGTPHEAPAVDRGRSGGGGQVSQQAIMAVVTQNRRSLNLCYDRVLKHDSSLKSGRVVTHVKIGISGSVTGVSVPDPQYSGSEIGQCIAQTIKRWHFPSADAEYETEFPIILQAN